MIVDGAGGEIPTLDNVAPIAPGLPRPTAIKVEPRSVTQPGAARRGAAVIAGMTAALLHGLALLVLLGQGTPEAVSGGGGQTLEAISVTILTQSPVTESNAPRKEPTPAGASEPIVEDEGNNERTKSAEEEPLKQPETALKPVDRLEDANADEQKPIPPAETSALPQIKGSTLTRAANDMPVASGLAAASPGAVQHYAAAVRALLGRRKPRIVSTKGTVTITFRIASDGKVDFARITKPSGNSIFDEAFRALVVDAVFPKPPPEMTQEQLTYVIPFHAK